MRGNGRELGAATRVTVPGPVPLGVGAVSQAGAMATVQLHPALVVMVAGKVPPVAGSVALGIDREKAQPAAA